MIKNEYYQTYAHRIVRELHPEVLSKLVTIFLDHAALNLGCTTDRANLNRVIDIISHDYNMLPVHQIASAFERGSMGKLGAETRLIPKNINSWLDETRQNYLRIQEDKSRDFASSNKTFDLASYPMGKAIIKKMQWCAQGLMSPEEWDYIDIKQLAEAIERDGDVTYESFVNQLNKF